MHISDILICTYRIFYTNMNLYYHLAFLIM